MEAVRTDETVMAEINITPFTDVLLVLLIISMILAALVAPPGFEKTLRDPSSAPPTHATAARIIDVAVNERGAIFVDGRRSNERALDAAKAAGLNDVGFVAS